MDDNDIVRAGLTRQAGWAAAPPSSERIIPLNTEGPLDALVERLDAMERRLAAIDDLLRSITETMLTLGRTDAAIYDTVKALAKRVDAEADLAELRGGRG